MMEFPQQLVTVNPTKWIKSLLGRNKCKEFAASDNDCRVEVEKFIEDAGDNKKTLVSTMDLVTSLMKEVECKEKAAKQAKEDSAQSCLDILAEAEKLNDALKHAKEANNMRARQVNAEKAVLVYELKELWHRLQASSDEQNKAIGLLDEMHRELEIRLSAALKEIETAEQEKLAKERFARETLAHTEKEMEKAAEELKMLKREAVENSKLREFVTDRGHAVDMLQGEICVICEDVKVLKEKFEKRIMLSWTPLEPQPETVDSKEPLKKSGVLAQPLQPHLKETKAAAKKNATEKKKPTAGEKKRATAGKKPAIGEKKLAAAGKKHAMAEKKPTAAKKPPPKDATRTATDKNKMRNQKLVDIYISKLLKQIHPDIKLPSKAMGIIESTLTLMFLGERAKQGLSQGPGR